MRIDKIDEHTYGVFIYSEDGKECLFTGSFMECSEWMFYNI